MSNGENDPNAGSNPAKRTTFPQETSGSTESRTDPAQNTGESEAKRVKFPKVIRHRKAEATIYGKKPDYQFYRVAYYDATHKRRMKHFATYSEALTEATKLVKELAQGSPASALSASQARDALCALQRLEAFRQSTGKVSSLLGVVSEYAEAASKLNGRTLAEAVEGYLGSVATVTRKDIKEAVEEFLAVQAPLARSTNGERSQISSKYHYNREIQLRRLADTFPNSAVCDLTKPHLDKFLGSLSEFSAKSRNHYRATIRQFLEWSTRKDYLPRTHRLFEADSMRPELANHAEIEFYTTKEFRALLETAQGPMQAMIALGGLAGLRTAELLRLTWEEIWRVPGHVEVTAGKAKTRQRRLIEVCPALASWLEPFRVHKSGKVCPIMAASAEIIWQQQFVELCEQVKVIRKANGLRHSFCTYHFAQNANENLTAALAGNSPAMIHSHYKGLATKAEAEKWFAVAPAKAANVIALAGAAKAE